MSDPVLVDPRVSRAKFEREVGNLLSPVVDVRSRGWIVESAVYPTLRVTFLTAHLDFPFAEFTAEMDFTNYDVVPPSVKLLHPVTLQPMRAFGYQLTERGVMNIVVGGHPETGLPFVCLPGVREYHTHPEHDGDSWDLYRARGDGRPFVVLDRLWKFCVRPAAYLIVPLKPNTGEIPVAKPKP
jgi:hypothetical protein